MNDTQMVMDIVCGILGLSDEEYGRDKSLVSMGADSLDIMEIELEIDEAFHTLTHPAESRRWRTPRDIEAATGKGGA